MSMPISAKRLVLLVLLYLFIGSSCRRDDYQLYGVEPVPVSGINTGKSKQKSSAQYISIVYANLFQKALSANQLVEITNLIESIGDKQLAHEIILSNFMNRPDVLIPSMTAMRSDVDGFITDTYKRFLVREPSASERSWFKNFIETNTFVTPEIVYLSFALCDEYQFY